jgi:hypothetical protein
VTWGATSQTARSQPRRSQPKPCRAKKDRFGPYRCDRPSEPRRPCASGCRLMLAGQ